MAREVTKTIAALISSTLKDIDNDDSDAVIQLDGEFPNLAIDIANTGANLTAFALLGRVRRDTYTTTWHKLIESTGWDTVAGILKHKVGTIKTLASGSAGFAYVDVGPIDAIKFQASIANGARNKGTFTAAANPTNTKASGELTITVLTTENFANGEEVVIDGVTYTMVSALTTDPAEVPFEVLIGATANDSMDNLAAAINGDAGAGTLYGTGTTAHTSVTGAVTTVVADEILTVTAITPGTAGNSIATTTDSTEAAWGAGVLAGGTLETVTIGSTVYTFRADGFVASAYDVLIGATASDTLDNLIAAINAAAGAGTLYGAGTAAHPTVSAAAGAGDTMDVTVKITTMTNAVGTLIATTETCAQCSWGDTTLLDGVMTAVTVNVVAQR